MEKKIVAYKKMGCQKQNGEKLGYSKKMFTRGIWKKWNSIFLNDYQKIIIMIGYIKIQAFTFILKNNILY